MVHCGSVSQGLLLIFFSATQWSKQTNNESFSFLYFSICWKAELGIKATFLLSNLFDRNVCQSRFFLPHKADIRNVAWKANDWCSQRVCVFYSCFVLTNWHFPLMTLAMDVWKSRDSHTCIFIHLLSLCRTRSREAATGIKSISTPICTQCECVYNIRHPHIIYAAMFSMPGRWQQHQVFSRVVKSRLALCMDPRHLAIYTCVHIAGALSFLFVCFT